MRCVMRPIGLLFVACLALLTACGSNGSSDTGTRSQNHSGAATTAGAAATAIAQPKGELRIGADFLPANLDPTKAFNLQRFGVGETLTRLTTDLKPEPWLAREVTNVDPTTWRVSLRPNVTFHDGSPM